MKNLILLILLAILLVQCRFFDDKLSLPLMPYNGNQLRIDGYYYQIGYDGKTLFGTYFFYKNGILIPGEGIFDSFEKMDESVKRRFIDKQSYKSDKLHWGVFLIEDNSITFERWHSGTSADAYVREGVILNDTTFHITKIYRGNKSSLRNEKYYFRKFSPKPDSTNIFIKN